MTSSLPADGRRGTPGTEKIANEGMLDRQHFCCRPAGDESLIGEHGQTRRQPGQRLGIVRHHHHRETEFLLQHSEQLDEVLAAIRVEAGSRLVENQQFGLQRQARARATRLTMPPDNSAGISRA
jgi:hypothetical protein